MDNAAKERPWSVTLALILLVLSIAEDIPGYVITLLSPERSQIPTRVWVLGVGISLAQIVLVILLVRRYGWARIGVLALLAWDVRNAKVFLLQPGLPPTWVLSRLPPFFWIQVVGSVVLCIVFWTSWQRRKQIPTYWLWIAAALCILPASGRDRWYVQIFFSTTILDLCGALLLFKRESNAWFRRVADP